MNLLMIVANYPHAGHPSSGAFNERSARALTELGHRVDVLAPRPYLPRSVAAFNPRWRAYEQIVEHESRGGISLYRPPYLQLPGVGAALKPDWTAYISCRGAVARRHEQSPYDAILAFNLIGAGGLAWRLGRRLGIPAAGWATGNDVRVPAHTAHGRAVRETLQRLDLVFYQSTELLDRAAALSGLPRTVFSARRHGILARGVEPAPVLPAAARSELRAKLAIDEDRVLALFLGRIVRAKGVFDLLDAMERIIDERPDLFCALVGAHHGFDDSADVEARLERAPRLAPHVRLVPACAPESVWQYLNAADLFVFPSHSEGMPNSLLEAMAAGVPSIAYAIPPVLEIDAPAQALMTVAPLDVNGLSRAMADLAGCADLRRELGARGRARVLSRYQTRASMAAAVARLAALIRRSSEPLPRTAPVLASPTPARSKMTTRFN